MGIQRTSSRGPDSADVQNLEAALWRRPLVVNNLAREQQRLLLHETLSASFLIRDRVIRWAARDLRPLDEFDR